MLEQAKLDLLIKHHYKDSSTENFSECRKSIDRYEVHSHTRVSFKIAYDQIYPMTVEQLQWFLEEKDKDLKRMLYHNTKMRSDK